MPSPAKLSTPRSGVSPQETLAELYSRVRNQTATFVEPLSEEDCLVQSMPDASPAKWHLAHTTWFFETFVLPQTASDYTVFDRGYSYLFNSYYNTVGSMHPRSQRGLLTRPTLATVREYRDHVDEQMRELLVADDGNNLGSLRDIVVLGLHHEQQHQELLLTDIKHAFSCNPTYPAYAGATVSPSSSRAPAPVRWISQPESVSHVGHGGEGFAFDNEGPRHRQVVEAYEIATLPVTVADYLEFMADDGYRRPELWLSDGWTAVNERAWNTPAYWFSHDAAWKQFTLAGLQPLDPTEPISHLSYYEADAFARWADARLPSEAEWELVAQGLDIEGNFSESGRYHPTAPPGDGPRPSAFFGDVWEWTSSPYRPYPGYQAPPGALGEYNGKFMSSQMVLRGGSCATPQSHIRATYRNFFPPDARWQFAGLRLARDART